MERTRYRNRTDPKHLSGNPHRRTKRVAKRKPSKPALKSDRTFINIAQEMKHGRGPRR
jgi:hypothetical protein